jgi:hypothetical protein
MLYMYGAAYPNVVMCVSYVHKIFICMSLTSPHNNHEAVQQVKRILSNILDLDRSGGNVFVRDDDTVIIADKFTLHARHIKLIQSRFPHICIDIVSASSSRSGFMVLLTQIKPYNRMWQRCVLRLVMHFVIFAGSVLCVFDFK